MDPKLQFIFYKIHVQLYVNYDKIVWWQCHLLLLYRSHHYMLNKTPACLWLAVKLPSLINSCYNLNLCMEFFFNTKYRIESTQCGKNAWSKLHYYMYQAYSIQEDGGGSSVKILLLGIRIFKNRSLTLFSYHMKEPSQVLQQHY